jgi:hypothetical protein
MYVSNLITDISCSVITLYILGKSISNEANKQASTQTNKQTKNKQKKRTKKQTQTNKQQV